MIRNLLGALVVFLLPVQPQAATVTVFAAASLSDALKSVAADYEKISGDKVIFNFAASGPLARQIEEGAPADLFISADEAKADGLEKMGLLVKESRVSLLGNALVLVVPNENVAIHSPTDLTNAAVRRVAIGDIKTVPAGSYTKTYLEKLGLWPAIEAKAVPCDNVRAVLSAVESGNVEVGFVYKTDAAISRKVKVAFSVAATDGPKITYPLALVKDAPQPEAAKKFLSYLQSKKAAEVFRQAGFVILGNNTIK